MGFHSDIRTRQVNFHCSYFRRVPPRAVKTCAVRPVFARVVGELRAADPSDLQGPVKQNASPGNNLRLRDQGGCRGRSRNQDQKARTVSTCWSNPGGICLILSKASLDRESAVWTGNVPSRQQRALKNTIWRCWGLRCRGFRAPPGALRRVKSTPDPDTFE